MNIMNILYVSQYFPPEIGAPAARVSELSRIWSERGHKVTVLTGFPNHPTGVVHSGYRGKLRRLILREQIEGTRVERTWLIPLPNRKSWERILNYSSFCLSAAIRGLFLGGHDVIIASSPQLLVGLAGLLIAKAKRLPFILEIRDLWPESLVAVGVSDSKSMLFRMLGAIAGLLYRHADHIVVVSPAFRRHLAERWDVSPQKVSVVLNGVDTELFHPSVDTTLVAKECGLRDKFVVSFIGTIGNAHGLNTIVESARQLKDVAPDVLFLVVGEGAEKEKLERLVLDAGLNNVRIVGQQPRARIPAFICASDLCLVLLKKSEVFKTVIPTKMLEFMACGRPVVLGVEGVAREILETAGAGIAVPPQDPDALVRVIQRLHANAGLRASLGQNGTRFIAASLTREWTADEYLNVLSAYARKAAEATGKVRFAKPQPTSQITG
jgi:colanic acid biosynthesis glycosyl transferase WcaI